MGIYPKIIAKLEDTALCDRIRRDLKENYSRRYIEKRYNVTRRTIDHIINKTMK